LGGFHGGGVVPTIKASTGATHHTASAYHAAIDVADRDFGEVGVSLDAVVHGVVLQVSGRDDGWTGHATSTCEDAAPVRGDRRRVGALRDGGADQETALAEATTIDAWRIPTREALLVMKFMAATSPFRGLDRRRQDILDLVRLYRAIDPDDLDRAMISRLAGMMYGGADAELAELFGRIDRDEPISL